MAVRPILVKFVQRLVMRFLPRRLSLYYYSVPLILSASVGF